MKARTPTKGLRQKLRARLRELGVTEKFRTQESRAHSGPTTRLLVISKDLKTLPLTMFEGHVVALLREE